MPAPRPVTIVGGGLAGLTLGIGLRRQDVPVVLHEAGTYPRHRVCGEFISGRGQEVLQRLGLETLLRHAGATDARTAAFFFGRRRATVQELPQPALCLSRFELDELLATQFLQAGGDLRENSTWRGPRAQPGVVLAHGRRRPSGQADAHWFGLKLHAKNVALIADLEMHVITGGYVGVCRLPRGETNVCGLFRRPRGRDERRPHASDILRGEGETSLTPTLAGAEFDEASSCAVAGLDLRPRRGAATSECALGDALTMIPPLTGNGMSMAFEAAEAAIAPLAAYAHARLEWVETRKQIGTACDALFAHRLAWARLAQWLMFTPLLQAPAALALRSTIVWRTLFQQTR